MIGVVKVFGDVGNMDVGLFVYVVGVYFFDGWGE